MLNDMHLSAGPGEARVHGCVSDAEREEGRKMDFWERLSLEEQQLAPN